MHNSEREKNYKASDIAKICDVGINAVQKWLNNGKIRSFRTMGGHYRVRRPDLIAYLKTAKIRVPDFLSATQRQRILIVEDDAMVRRLIHRLIEKEFAEIEIHEAEDGYEAGYKTLLLKPSLIILDLLLPRINGIKVCRIIRADENLKDTRILAISGYRPERIGKTILKAGADAFIKKSFENKNFVNVVSDLLGLSTKVGN